MLIYEVNLSIEADIYNDYLVWLKAHVRDILKIQGFQEAKIFCENNLNDTSNKKSLVVQYSVTSKADLENYLANHAPKMRAEGIKKFGDRFSAARRVLELVETQTSEN